MMCTRGFSPGGVKLGTLARGDRMLLIFAGTYYGLNVGGWAMERAGKDRDGRADPYLMALGPWGTSDG